MDILKTNEANCKDCYKCLRYCPVNAIKVSEGHAQVDPDRCILDGQCYKACPQHAKTLRYDIEKVKEIIKYNNITIASIAPSFFAYYQEPARGKILTALRYLGFDKLEQTARAANAVALAHLEYFQNEELVITSSCPSIVLLMEKYYPDLLKYLAPVVSPMAAHYKILEKEQNKPFKMVFIGPCIAKKKEVEGTDIAACLTFEEIDEWIKQEELNIDELEPAKFEHNYPIASSLFPLLGGLIKTAGLDENILDNKIFSVNGVNEAQELFRSIREGGIKSGFIEILACQGGCIMGPAKPECVKNTPYFDLKANLINSINEITNTEKPDVISVNSLFKEYSDKSLKLIDPTEEEINEILASIGKTTPDDEYNCSACGYNSCRDKAKAVIQGMAEKEMCIPFMKSQAERLSAIVLESTPNSVVILDKNLCVIETNPAFLKFMKMEKADIKGKHISLITDDLPFKEVLNNRAQVVESRTLINDRAMNRIVFSVPDQKLIAGIFVDITDSETQKAALLKVRNETLERAQKVIDKQMRVAQEVAGLIGETTAETKVLLGQLVKILQQD